MPAIGDDLSPLARRTGTIASRLREARELRGLAYRDVARLALLAPSTVQAIGEGRSRNPGALTLGKLARALKVRPAWLVYGDGEP